MKITTSSLIRWAGLSAMVAGICFVLVGMFHLLNTLSSVTTSQWGIVYILATAMGFFGLLGLTGIYARQAEKSGWLGLAGFVLFSLWLGLIIPFSFVEAFVVPQLATEYPAYVEGFLGMFTGFPSELDFGFLPILWKISDPIFLLAPLLFGIATFRAGILPRGKGAFLAFGSLMAPIAALVPPEYQPKVMIPIGLAMVWLGYALVSERREKAAALSPAPSARPEPSQAA